MKNSKYYHNIKILKQNHSNIYEILANNNFNNFDDDVTNISVINTRSGIPTFRIKVKNTEITLHSKVNPLLEIDRIINLKLSGIEDAIIIIGFGLGYLIEKVIQKSLDARIFVYEPSLKILQKAFETRDLTKILKNQNIKIIVKDPNIYDSILDYQTIYNPVLLHLRSYRIAFPDFAEKIIESFNGYIQKNIINIATLKRFDRLWSKNSFKNSIHFFTKPGINLLSNFFNRNTGALVIGAGPSIERDLPNIKKIKQKIILISVDTAFRPLIKHGIIPDFVVSVDPQYINSLSLNPAFYRKIKRDKMPILVADPAIYPTTIRNYPGKIILTSSIFPPGKIIEYFSGYKGKIAAGGSVAVTAFDLARVIGADPIILIGLDLSYKAHKSHVRGSFVDLYRMIMQNRINTHQSQFLKYLKGGMPIKITNNRKELCYTDKRMLLYKSWFERNIPFSKSSIINATNGGLELKDVREIQLKNINIDNSSIFKKEILIDNLKSKIFDIEDRTANIFEFLNYLKEIEKNLRKMLDLAIEARETVAKMGLDKSFIDNSFYEGNKKLSEIENTIISFKDEIKLISMTMQDTVEKIMKGVQGKNRDSIINNSDILYRSIEESCNFLLKTIKNTKTKLNFLISKSDNKIEDVDNL